ncbi:dimethyl sulfoxide reductase subunit A [Bacillus sp. V3-13]|uniref:DMSO/selenate family reductase complex A subunit n=1 Tax=Bacillus sp. V3-13 TaxID=2053728 RepID=UPI000C78F725|nr:DMSO/selenate family reductase complex A subunit [Bacillus sp. V3-13]PLR77450.1 dimethyl sulfoxide reductase subunit A [Bacillus sp. V3-13]
MSNNLFEKIANQTMPRRTFLKWTGAITAPAVLGGAVATKHLTEKAKAAESMEDELVIPTCGTTNCGGRCLVKAHVKNGTIVRITTDDAEEDSLTCPQIRACIRGRSYRQFVYHPDRLKYPMKRVGKRGEGKFERISWDEAIETIYKETERITKKYGPASRYSNYASGNWGGLVSGRVMFNKLMGLTGGYLGYHNTYSTAQTNSATPFTYGTASSGSSLDSLVNSKLIILWGHNPAETIWGTTNFYLKKAKEAGAKIYVVDPRYSDTAVALADEWFPIRPTTDNALMDAMTYVIITENLHDKEFLDKYCIGHDETHMPEGVPEGESLQSYILGEKDGIAKTPEWAEKICGLSANKIRQLAREYATAKPAALIQGWGPQRNMNGEQIVRGGTVLASLTGNVGVNGGWASGAGYFGRTKIASVPNVPNPLKLSIPCFLWTDAIIRGTEMSAKDGVLGLKEGETLPSNIKLIFNCAGNALINQHGDINRTKKILEDESLVEFIVVSDIFMTPSAKYADILLPSNTFFERYDIGTPWGFGDYAILSQKVTDSLYESKSDYEWMTLLAKKMGLEQEFSQGKTEEDWAKWVIEETRKQDPSFPTWEQMKKQGIHKWKFDKPTIGFEEQIKNPDTKPFPTPSGKIEIFSKRLWEMDDPEKIPAIPKHIAVAEGPEGSLTKKYPLQLIGWHYKRRCHSTHDNNVWMEEASRQEIWMNPIDADKRNIKKGDVVTVFNDRGIVKIPVAVTNRIIPGVVAIPQGAWYKPDKDGVDTRGCINVLTTLEPSPLAKGNPQHTNLVEVEKA